MRIRILPRRAVVIAFAHPGFLVAGLLAALLPLALHLIARRPPQRAALPTLRFLAPDPRTAVRIQRRPVNLLLLALRMLLLVLLGAGLAGPAWFPDRAGTAEVVLLDRGLASRDPAAWRRAVDEARRRLLGPGGERRGELVLFDTAAVPVPRGTITPAWLDSLTSSPPPPAPLPVDYAAALRSLRTVAPGLRGADSARATLLTRPRWDGWRPGLADVRRAAWPGALALPDLGTPRADRASVDTSVSTSPSTPRDTAIVIADEGAGVYVTAALEAMGWTVRHASPDAPVEGDARLFVVLSPVSGPAGQAIGARVRAGASVLVSGDAGGGGLASLVPWRAGPGRETGEDGGEIYLSPRVRLAGAAGRVDGTPAAGARTAAAWDDGRPAVAAARVGSGCAVYVAARLEGGRMPLSASYPRALAAFARGCDAGGEEGITEGGIPLDAGALAVLRGDGLPPAVATSAVAGPGGGTPLGRWLLAAALAVALVETALAYGRRRSA